MNNSFSGIYPAVITPFDKEGAPDLDRFAVLLDYLYKTGVDGVYVGGNTGEWYSQSTAERKAVVRQAQELSTGRGKVFFHVGSNTTEEALHLARYAEELGVSAISSLPPYIARWSDAEVIHYYERLSSATQLPCFVYYFPSLTGATSSGQPFFRAIRDIGRVAGIKFTDMNLYDLVTLVEYFHDGLAILNGHDQVLLAGLVMGADGGIGSFYNAMPERFVDLYRCYQNGNLDGARAIQTAINRVIRVAKSYRLVPTLRFMMRLRGIDVGKSREPTLMLDALEERKITAELCKAGFP